MLEKIRALKDSRLVRTLAGRFDSNRIGMRLLGTDGLAPVEWLYLKMALTGLGNPDAKYVMIDEVQDYTAAQLAVLARYFRRAHFLLLGDPNQAIAAGTATFDEVRAVFEAAHGPVEECRLMTSYRSTPEITELFASLLDDEERASISSIQRADTPPTILSCPDETSYATALREAYQDVLSARGFGPIQTVISTAPDADSNARFWYAEDYHQQYLFKNPGGYECHARTGVACPALPSE